MRFRRRHRGGVTAQRCEGRGRGKADLPKILIVGSPNVGKSALFNKLTGRYVTVSNYPGTTVEVSRGRARIPTGHYEVIDTPGMYSLSPITDEERVACQMLLSEPADAVLHVIDAKNIERMLGLTLQLIEAGLPVILVLNMSDEARQLGVHINAKELGRSLHIPVVETVATTGRGVGELAVEIGEVATAPATPVDYGAELERAIAAIGEGLDDTGPVSRRTRALLLLQQDDDELARLLAHVGPEKVATVREAVVEQRNQLEHSPHYRATMAVRRHVEAVLKQHVTFPKQEKITLREKLSQLCMHPITGIPVLLLALYGLYEFVGVFGAGTIVDWLETNVFDAYVSPWCTHMAEQLIPWERLRSLFVGEYGIITLGLRYAIAIVLPIVGTFFLAFSLLEDSGYLPRLAMLIDRVFKKIGLNGRAVIPIVLGFGCATMATIVTRTLESKRERVIASFLLALAIPCSAQLGVILGLLSARPAALVIWMIFVGGVFLLAGLLAAKLMPGRRPSFYMELPPLRLPKPINVAVKTYTRMVWYFREILPLFILASVLIWLGQWIGLFQWLLEVLTPAVRAMGLPDQAAVAFLFGFFRRDYGAAGLMDLQKDGFLNGVQLTVAAITLTLFLPCIAQFLVLKKERGWKLTLLATGSIVVIAFTVGFLVNLLLTGLGVTL